MRLTGEQAREIAEISDGTTVVITGGGKTRGDIKVVREEDGLSVLIGEDGITWPLSLSRSNDNDPLD